MEISQKSSSLVVRTGQDGARRGCPAEARARHAPRDAISLRETTGLDRVRPPCLRRPLQRSDAANPACTGEELGDALAIQGLRRASADGEHGGLHFGSVFAIARSTLFSARGFPKIVVTGTAAMTLTVLFPLLAPFQSVT